MPELVPAPESLQRFLPEIGRVGLKQSKGQILEEQEADLRGTNGVKVYEEMRNDPAVATGLRAISWILQRVPWRVVDGGDSSQDETAGDLVRTAMADMDYPWQKLIRDALTCLPFGWSYCEVVYKQRAGPEPGEANGSPSIYDDGLIGWKKVQLISQATLNRWEIDEFGTILGMWQTVSQEGGSPKTIFIPIEKSLLFRIEDERNNPEGVSLLRPVYTSWWAKKQIQEIEAIGIERDLTGVLIIKMPTQATDADYKKALDLLEQYKVDDMTGFVAPQFGPNVHEQWQFEIINSPGNKSIDVGQVILRYSAEIARMFLVQFLMLGMGSNGSWALSRDQRDMFQLALETLLDNFADVFNRYMIPPLMRLNGFDTLTEYPMLKHGRIARADMTAFANAVVALQQAKLISFQREDEQFIREELDLPELPDEFEWKTPEERNIENIVDMQTQVGQIADAQGRVQTPSGRPTPNRPDMKKSPTDNPSGTSSGPNGKTNPAKKKPQPKGRQRTEPG